MSRDSDYFFRQIGRSYWLSNLGAAIRMTVCLLFWGAVFFTVLGTIGAVVTTPPASTYFSQDSAHPPIHSRVHKKGTSTP